jgi:proteasome lid subunit RPN8/RPN11
MADHTSDSKVHVAPWVLTLIKQHALHHSQEIYGWLIGRETTSGKLYVCSAMSCEHYQEQSQIGAAPDPRDQQGIGNALPNGLGIIGIYHSHPAEIFHSSVDNRTLRNLSKFYPHILSAVTNADHYPDPTQNSTKWFQMDKEGVNIREITIGSLSFPSDLVSTVICRGDFVFDVELPCEGNLSANLLRILLELFEYNWFDTNFAVSRIKAEVFSSSIKNIEGKGTDPPYAVAKLSSSKKLGKWLRRGDLLIMGKIPARQIPNSSLKSDFRSSSPTPSPTIRIMGHISLFTVASVDLSVKISTLEPIVAQMKADFIDDLILKVSRGCFSSLPSPPSGIRGVTLKTPETYLPLYPGISPAITLPLFLENLDSLASEHEQAWLILSHLAPSFPRENFPQLTQVIALENQILDNFSQRATVLGYSDQRDLAQSLLEDLKEMHMRRGNLAQADLHAEKIHAFLSSAHHEDLKNDHSN